MTASAGTSASPSIHFSSDTNTGIFSPAADTIAFAEGGVEAMRIDSSGNVGIGTASPKSYARVHQSSSSANCLLVEHVNNGIGAIGQTGTSTIVAAETNMLFKTGFTFADGPFSSGTERARIDSSGNLLMGTTTNYPGTPKIAVNGSIQPAWGQNRVAIVFDNDYRQGLYLDSTARNMTIFSTTNDSGGNILFSTRNAAGASDADYGTERARIGSSGTFLVGKTSTDLTVAGVGIEASGVVGIGTATATPMFINRQSTDGTLIEFRHADVAEGTISVSGTTVSYNGGHLSRWAQMPGTKDDTLVKGTVMSNLDEMNVYTAPTTYWTEEDELPEGVNVGDVKVETHAIDNEQLNKVKVSDVEGDANVAGVFVNWTYDEAHQVDEINMAMTGDMIIRIAQGVVVQKGDLLMSAGDGTAKPQGDDIVRSKTVAKVTSNHVTCTYADGSYCVPCVLMAC
jgi:hypothetical protein